MPHMEQLHLTLSDMALFVEIARAGNFRKAAVLLSMPPSTLSRRISAMERRLGVPLFLRTTRSVTLTSVANSYYERCLDVLEAAGRAQAVLSPELSKEMMLRMSMPVDLGVELLGTSIAAFVDSNPGLRVEFDLSSRAVDLLREPIDVAIRLGRPMDDRLVARKIGEISSGVFASPSMLRRHDPITRPEQLVELPCLDLRTAQGSMPWRLGNWKCDAAPGKVVLAANSVALIRRLAEEGRGIALLPNHLVAQSVRQRRLERVLPDQVTPSWPVYAVTVGRVVPRLVTHLISHLKNTLTHLSQTTE